MIESLEYKNEGKESDSKIEHALTSEDRERLSALFHEIGDDNLRSDYNHDTDIARLRMRVRQEGDRAAEYLLEKIEEYDVSRDEGDEMYNYLSWLFLCASREHAQRVGELLLKDPIGFQNNRSNKVKTFEILERIAVPNNADHVTAFVDKILSQYTYKGTKEDDARLKFFDMYDSVSTLYAILQAGTDPQQQEKIEGAIETVKEKMSQYGFTPLKESSLDSIKRYTTPDYIQEKFEFLFHDMGDTHTEEGEDITEQDEAIEEEYEKANYNAVLSRLKSVKSLHHEAEKEKNAATESPEEHDANFLRRHWLEYREKNPSPHIPTLGIEIEISENSLPPASKEEKNISYKKYLKNTKKKYEKIEQLGIPSGMRGLDDLDPFWEFAHNPAYYHYTLSSEVSSLIELGLIKKQHKTKKNYDVYPLHLTLGGITASYGYGPNGRAAYILARALEASAWCTDRYRLIQPYATKKQCWTIRGMGGVEERDFLYFNMSGIQIRTLQFKSISGLDRLLRSASLLGAACKAYQRGGVLKEKSSEQNNAGRKLLSHIWKEFSEKTVALFLKYDLPSPDYIWSDPNPLDNKMKSEFVKLANVLGDAEKSSKSRGADFVKEMRRIIITSRAKVAKIVYPEIFNNE